MVMVFLLIQMAIATKDSFLKEKRKVKEPRHGLMGKNSLDLL